MGQIAVFLASIPSQLRKIGHPLTLRTNLTRSLQVLINLLLTACLGSSDRIHSSRVHSLKMSSIIQKALALEACLNVPCFVGLLFFPRSTLSTFLVSPWSGSAITPTTILFARAVGATILALTPQLLFALPDSKGVAEQRKLVYLTLGTGEAALIPLFLWEAFRATDAEKMLSGGGFSRSSALLSVATFLLLLIWRVWVWDSKPHWFEQSGGSAEKRKTR